MSRANDDMIIIGGGGAVDEMELAARGKAKKPEPKAEPEAKPQTVDPAAQEIYEPVTIGGAADDIPAPEPAVGVKAPVIEEKLPEKKPEIELRIPEHQPPAAAPMPKPAPKPAPAPVQPDVSERIAAAQSDDIFEKNFLVTSSPHLHCGETTSVLMQDVIFALLPAAITSVIFYGWRAAMLIVLCIATCCLTEYICRRVMKRRQTVGDYSACVTGMLLAFCLPPTINPLFAVIGCIVAIVVVKQMFGGIGMNFANPAATARIVMMLSFPAAMTTYVEPFFYRNGGAAADAVTSATPLAALAAVRAGGEAALPTLLKLFTGYHGGCLGETCAIALLLGGGYLLLRGVITWEIPVSFMGTVALIALVAGEDPLYHLMAGGVLLGAIFMATDYVTSPVNRTGKLIFGFGCGLLTMCIRLFCSMSEGVSFAILLMNIITPHIDRLTLPRVFGEEREAA